jgi:hypothetical protein
MKLGLVLVVIAACNDGKTPAEPGPATPTVREPPPKPESGFDKVTVLVDGTAVAMTAAYIKRLAPDRFQVYLSSKGGSCNELLSNMFDGRDRTRVYVLADLTPRLAADGTLQVEVSDLSMLTPAPGSKAVVKGSADRGTKVDVTLDVRAVGAQRKVEVHGAFTAEGCGTDVPDTARSQMFLRHPSTATVTIAGTKLPLRSATVTGDDVALSTGPRNCDSSSWSAVIVSKERGFWGVGGTWLATEQRVTSDPDEASKALQIKRGAKGTSTDGRTVQLQLSGAGKINDYPVVLDGAIEALDCPR